MSSREPAEGLGLGPDADTVSSLSSGRMHPLWHNRTPQQQQQQQRPGGSAVGLKSAFGGSSSSSSSTNPTRGSSKKTKDYVRISNDNYVFQLGEEIGRGAQGLVFQAFNVVTGDFVAAKRFSKEASDDSSIDNDYLSAIEAEIALIQKLNHPNIVKYIDTIRSSTHLYIILEYMEHGSLAQVLQRFGAVSEPLAAMYIHQVLLGLQYLHAQGVLHRDIKGANVLTSKEGIVKLADFGVAMQINAGGETDGKGEVTRHVVGSPYWMAPEIIDMEMPTAMSDIWSVGCLVIELLTCRPPYFHLQPMAAMYHVVQDDYPPLPDLISALMQQFLMSCFCKVPSKRETAEQLLQSPWLVVAVNLQSVSPKSGAPVVSASKGGMDNNRFQPPDTATCDEEKSEVVMTSLSAPAGNENEEDKKSDAAATERSAQVKMQSSGFSPLRMLRAEKESEAISMNRFSFTHLNNFVAAASSSQTPTGRGRSVSSSGIILPAPIVRKLDLLDQQEWKDMTRKSGERGKVGVEVTGQGGEKKGSLGLRTRGASKSSDLEFVDIDNSAAAVFTLEGDKSRSCNESYSLECLSSMAIGDQSLQYIDTTTNRNVSSSGSLLNDDDDRPNEEVYAVGNSNLLMNSKPLKGDSAATTWEEQLTASFVSTHNPGGAVVGAEASRYQSHREMSTADRISALTRSTSYTSTGSRGEGNFTAHIEPTVIPLRPSSTGSHTPSAQDRAEYSGRGTPTLHDLAARLRREMVREIASVKNADSEEAVANICESMLLSLSSHPEAMAEVVGAQGVVPLIEMYDKVNARYGSALLHHVLRVINFMITDNSRAQEQLALGGFLPSVLRLIDRAYKSATVTSSNTMDASARRGVTEIPSMDPFLIEAAIFLHEIATTSPMAFRLLIGAGGLQAFVQLLLSALHNISNISTGKSSVRSPALPSSMRTGGAQEQMLWEDSSSLASHGGTKTPEKDDIMSIHSTPSARSKRFQVLSNQVQQGKANEVLEQSKRVIYVAVDCINNAYQVEGMNDKSFCPILIRLGLLPPLAKSFSVCMNSYRHQAAITLSAQSAQLGMEGSLAGEDETSQASTQHTASKLEAAFSRQRSSNPDESYDCKYAARIATLMLLFTYGDSDALESLTRVDSGILSAIMVTLQSHELRPTFSLQKLVDPFSPGALHDSKRKKMKSPELSAEYIGIIEVLLRSLKNISIDASTLTNMDKAGAVLSLIPLLKGPHAAKFQDQIVPCLFNLCRMNRRRQEQAALSGVIPFLIRLIGENSSLKQFALPIMCDFAYSTNATRIELWKHDGVAFYTNLLQDAYWKTYSLNSLAVWLVHDVAKVEGLLLASPHINRLIELFRVASKKSRNALNNTFYKMMVKSSNLCKILGSSGLFVSALITRISEPNDTLLLLSYLKMLQLIHQHHFCPRQLVLDHNIYTIVRKVADASIAAQQVLVCEKCKQILMDFQTSTFT